MPTLNINRLVTHSQYSFDFIRLSIIAGFTDPIYKTTKVTV